jgi:hypothetical protein
MSAPPVAVRACFLRLLCIKMAAFAFSLITTAHRGAVVTGVARRRLSPWPYHL